MVKESDEFSNSEASTNGFSEAVKPSYINTVL